MAGYKNKNACRCNRQGVWQVASTVQTELSKVAFVNATCQLRRLLTIHGWHLSLSVHGVEKFIRTTEQAPFSSPSANRAPFYGAVPASARTRK